MTAGRYWPSGSVGSLLRWQRSSELGLTDAAVTESRHLFSCPKMARLLGFVLAFGSDKPSEISERHGGWSGHEPKAARYEGDRNRNSHGCTREAELKHPIFISYFLFFNSFPPKKKGYSPAHRYL